MENDIELAVTGLGKQSCEWLIGRLPANYFVEDRSANGYGLVIRSDLADGGNDVNLSINGFLGPLLSLTEAIRGYACIVRIAILSPEVTTTITLNYTNLEILCRFNAGLEISVYPISEDD